MSDEVRHCNLVARDTNQGAIAEILGLRDYLEGLGLHIMLATETASLHAGESNGRPGRLREVRVRDGRTLPADLFLVAAGITPLVELARDAGLEVAKGVVVDDAMATSDPHVFAVGDVAEHRGRTYGLWPAAVEQGEVAAENALGGTRVYEGTVPVTMLKVVGVDLLSIGRFQAQDGDTVIAIEDSDEHSYRKLVIADDRIVGAILIARQQDAPHVTDAVKNGRDVSSLLPELQRGEWDGLAAEPAVA